MKNKKRLIARIGAVIAVVLMVGALAVPCFADYPQVIPPAPPSINMQTVYNQVYSYLLGVRAINPIVANYCRIYSVQDLVDYASVGGGYLTSSNVGIPIGYNDTNEVYFTSVNYVNYYFYITVNNLETYPALIQADIDIEFLCEESGITAFVTIHNDGTGEVYLEAEYDGYVYDDGDGNSFANFVISNGYVNLANTAVPINITTANNVYVGYVGHDSIALSMMNMLFYGYNYIPIDPLELFNGYLEGANYYNTNSWVDGWNAGFIKGYDYISEVDLYDQGYQDALDDIKSGDFGRNLLGQSFIAPFKAVTDLTLVEWQNQDGTIITITVGAILSAFIGISLFIWFLKMFAGG